MATSFLTRFYAEVADCLADPSSSKRFPNSARYRDLFKVQSKLYNRILNGSGQGCDLGRTEITVSIVEDQRYYPLPPLFQQFIAFERRTEGDPRLVEIALPSLDTWGPGPGLRILRDQNTFEFSPQPNAAYVGDWTLVYRRGPCKLHYATAANVAADSFDAGTPSTDAGDLVKIADYYAGVPFRIYSASAGAPQVNICTGNTVSGGGTVTLEFAKRDWSPVPSGTVLYEVMPELDEDVEGLYAIDVALLASSRRTNLTRRAGLLVEREDLWRAARGKYGNTAADRPNERSRPPRPYDDDPYD